MRVSALVIAVVAALGCRQAPREEEPKHHWAQLDEVMAQMSDPGTVHERRVKKLWIQPYPLVETLYPSQLKMLQAAATDERYALAVRASLLGLMARDNLIPMEQLRNTFGTFLDQYDQGVPGYENVPKAIFPVLWRIDPPWSIEFAVTFLENHKNHEMRLALLLICGQRHSAERIDVLKKMVTRGIPRRVSLLDLFDCVRGDFGKDEIHSRSAVALFLSVLADAHPIAGRNMLHQLAHKVDDVPEFRKGELDDQSARMLAVLSDLKQIYSLCQDGAPNYLQRLAPILKEATDSRLRSLGVHCVLSRLKPRQIDKKHLMLFVLRVLAAEPEFSVRDGLVVAVRQHTRRLQRIATNELSPKEAEIQERILRTPVAPKN